MPAYVYMVLCKDGSIYTGMTERPAHRFAQHKAGQGAQWTRVHGFQAVIYLERCGGRHDAYFRESVIKRMSHAQKRRLVSSPLNLVVHKAQ